MKYPCWIVLLIFCLVSNLNAQAPDTEKNGNASSYLNLNALPLLDPYAPRFRLGYIQSFSDRWQLGTDVGYGTKLLSLGRDLGTSYSLWEVRPEIYRVLDLKDRTTKYLSAEFFYIHQKNVFVDSNYRREGGGDFNYTKADYKRQKYGVHLKFGLFLDLGKNMGINFYGGVGFRFRNNEYTNVENPEINMDNDDAWFSSSQYDEGKDFSPNPTLGFKFYYKL